MTVYQVTHKGRYHGQQIRNMFYYETTVGEPSTSEWQDVVDEIRADYVAELAAYLVTEYLFYGIDYRVVTTAGLLALEALPTAGDWAGSSAIDSLTSQIAMLVSIKGLTTKPNRARTYLAGFHEQNVVDSLWIVGAKGAAEAFIDLQSALNTGGTNPLQRVSAQWNTSHTQVIAFNNIAARPANASEVPATQRRRRIGVGI